ncbi:E3 ubiquitin-protein ligase SP1-like [Apium graveolens]|uniref:E3 ubiquitin-protein ligase SP1-like n=1 Tax=Apium graveolens TaxID=4045 RepID=UPI003D791BF1
MVDMVIWGGAGCCVSAAAALFFLERPIHPQLLDTASTGTPLIVSVSGKVGSDSPIMCETSGLECVILKETTEKHILKRNWETIYDFRGRKILDSSWREEINEMDSVIKEDDGTDQVFVVGAQRASYWKSTVRHGRRYRPRSLPMTGRMDDIWEDMDLVVKTTEPVLLTGTPLTVIGEANKDETGTSRIRQPEAGPFYVSRMNIDELTDNLKGWAW